MAESLSEVLVWRRFITLWLWANEIARKRGNNLYKALLALASVPCRAVQGETHDDMIQQRNRTSAEFVVVCFLKVFRLIDFVERWTSQIRRNLRSANRQRRLVDLAVSAGVVG